MAEKRSNPLKGLNSSDSPASDYDREPIYKNIIQERDVLVMVRDGIHLCVDVYRPESSEKFPALLAFAVYNKDLQSLELTESMPPQPAWSHLWTGPMEAGDTRFLVSRGYVHVIGSPRGIGKSEGGGSREWDSYDLIEWIAAQPWCDGNVGMIGISGFGAEQLFVAKQQPPHLKAIFPYDSRGAYGDLGGFRDEYPGGVLHVFRYLLSHFSAAHENKGKPGPLPPEREKLWQEALSNPDYKMYPHIYNVVALKGQHLPNYFNVLIDPYDKEDTVEKSEREFEKIRVPTYTGSGWYGYTYKTHLQGSQTWYREIKAPKKLMFTGPAHLERPWHSFHREVLRWNDYWLKGIENGIMREPPVKIWVMGANEWRTAEDWPLPETEWTRLYLHGWEKLKPEPVLPSSSESLSDPEAFLQMPLTHTSQLQRLRYMTEPLTEDTLVIGPIALYLCAAIDQDDTNWIVILKDIGPDVSVRTAKESESEVPASLHEREITRGWLKASHRALDPKRSKPWKPWHPLTRAAWKKVVPGEINEYAIEICSTANLFKQGHRICLDITSMDLPTGVAGATNVEYIPYHICSAKTTVHRIYHNEQYPSYLLLPVIPR